MKAPKPDSRLAPEIVFWCLAGFAFAWHLVYVVVFPDVFFGPGDSKTYFATLLEWERTGKFHVTYGRTPLYPLFLWLTAKTLGLKYLPAIQHLSLVLAVIVMGLVLKRLFPFPKGTLAASVFILLSSFFPSQFLHASSMMTEGLESQALLAIILGFWLWINNRRAFFIVSLSFFVAAGLMLRPVNVFVLAPVCLAFLIILRSRAFAILAIFIAVTIVFSFPWMLFNFRQNGSFALSNIAVLPLTHSFGHLVSMEKKTFQPYKEAIRPSYLEYMRQRHDLEEREKGRKGGFYHLLLAGDACIGWNQILYNAFPGPMPETDAVLKRIILEGICDHPWQAASLVAERMAAFYCLSPQYGESWAYGHCLEQWRRKTLEPWAYEHYRSMYACFGMPSVEDPQRLSRLERAKPLIEINERLGRPFSVLVVLALWGSILLFPLACRRKNRHLAVFVFLLINIYGAVICLMVPPEPRFYYPMVIPVFFLLALEICGILCPRPEKPL